MPYSYMSLCQQLECAGISRCDAKEEAFLLLSRFCGVSRADCLCDRQKIYTSHDLDEAVQRRAQRYPLQYILGTWSFFGLDFEVNEHCLIPRPDTELLVETAIRHMPQGAVFADLCTGSGCVAISILSHRPDTKAYALELYPQTLSLAVKNAAVNGVADRFIPIEADLLQGGVEVLRPYAPLHAIVSNPPYIPRRVVEALEPELFFEPKAALDGGEDGLTFYECMLKEYVHLLKQEGQIFFEIGYDQAEALKQLKQLYLPNATYACLQDLGGQDRVVYMSTKS